MMIKTTTKQLHEFDGKKKKITIFFEGDFVKIIPCQGVTI